MQKFKTPIILLIIVLLMVGVVLFFKWDIEVSADKKHVVAIQGYDPVSYFKKGEAEIGSVEFDHFWNELTWRFTSAEHRDLFKNKPADYAPQFGGNCSFTTSLGKEQMGLAKHWQIKEGKLYLNSNLMANFLWKIFPSLIPEAEEQWILLIKNKEAEQAKKAAEIQGKP